MIYDTIITICEAKGITVWEMERELGFSNGCIRKWNESDPGIRKVQKVADYLGVSIEKLLDDESNGKTKEGYKDRNSKEKKGKGHERR